MKRRKFFTTSSLMALGASGWHQVIAAEAEVKQADNATVKPVVMAPRHDGCEILWLVNERSKGYIEYGLTDKLGTVERNDGWGLRPAGDRILKVRLDNLEPGKTYFYRTVTESFHTKQPNVRKSEIRSFTTLDPKAVACTFTIWNDTHKHKDTLKKLAELTQKSDFLLWNGDVCNDWHSEEDIAETILNANGSGVEMTKDHPLFLVRGNHDIRGAQAAKLEQYCAMPEGKPWYAFRQGPVAFICMDTGEDKPDDHANLFGRVACEPMRQEQAEWLAKVIEQPEIKSAPFRIVCCHIPLRWFDEHKDRGYDYHSQRSRELWHDSLVKWGAQAVISGHTHSSALFESTEDFPYAQLVGGGPKLHNAAFINGAAFKKGLLIQSVNLQGKVLHELKLEALG